MKKILSLFAALLITGSMLAGEYVLTPDKTSTGLTNTAYITTLTTFTYDDVTWAMNQWNPSSLQVKTNQTSAASEFRFYNTTPLPGKITKVVITFSALTVSNESGFMFVGGTNAVTATTGGTSATWDANTKTLTWTPTEDYTYFAFYQNGKVATGTNNLASSKAIVVTYESAEGGEGGGTTEPVDPDPDPVDPEEGDYIKETVDFSAQGWANQQKITSYQGDNFSASMSKGTGTTDPAFYTTGNALRLYGGNTLTVSSKLGNIVSITFTFAGGENNNEITAKPGTFTSPTWTGSASDVTFSIDGTTGHRRILTMEVKIEKGETEPSDPEEVKAGTYDIVPNNAFFGITTSGQLSVEESKKTQTGTQNGITISLDRGTSTTQMYITEEQTRVYNGYILTFSVPEGYNLTKIVFTYTGTIGQTPAANVGPISEDNTTWTGEYNSVKMTFGNEKSGNAQITKIVVTYEEVVEGKPSIDVENQRIDLGNVLVGEGDTYTTDVALEVTGVNLTDAIVATGSEHVTVSGNLTNEGGTLNLHIVAPVGALNETITLVSGEASVEIVVTGRVYKPETAEGTPIEMTNKGGTSALNATVNGTAGVKAGTGSAAGAIVVTVPAHTVKLNFFAAAWNGEKGEMSISVPEGVVISPQSVTLKADAGISGDKNNYFLQTLTKEDYSFSLELTGVTEETEITFSREAKEQRFVVWGAAYETIEPETATRTVEEGKYYTLCYEKKIVKIEKIEGDGDGEISLWSFAGKDLDKQEVYIKKAQEPYVAGMPYLMSAEFTGTVTFTFTGKAETDPKFNNGLYGTFTDMTQDDLDEIEGTVYLLSGNILYDVKDQEGNELSANRAYIVLENMDDYDPTATANNVRRIPLAPSVSTDLNMVENADKTMKVMIDGQLYIIRGEQMYDATGRPVK